MRHKAFLCAAIASALISFACVASADEYTDAIAKLSVPPRASVRAAAWDGSSARAIAPDANGTFGITNEAELAWLAKDEARNVIASLPRPTFEFMADLDLGGHDFTPIRIPNGSALLIRFNGNGHVIRGLRITGEHDSAALFVNYSDNADVAVQDLHLVDADIDVTNSGSASVGQFGSIIDVLRGGTIENCSVSGKIKVVSTNAIQCNIGGIFAASKGYDMTIKRCSSSVEITADGSKAVVGGLVGNIAHVDIVSCASFGSITSNGTASGGFIGEAFFEEAMFDPTTSKTTLNIKNSVNLSSVTFDAEGSGVEDVAAGGIVGHTDPQINLNIESTANYGTIVARGARDNIPISGGNSARDLAIGGLAGHVERSPNNDGPDIGKCANFAGITNIATGGLTVTHAGAFIGFADGLLGVSGLNAYISTSRSSGTITSPRGFAGGMVASVNNVNTSFDGCFTNLKPLGGLGDGAQPSPGECAVLSNAQDIENAIAKDNFDDISAFSVKTARAIRSGGAISIPIVEFPDASVRNTDGENITYTVSDENGRTIASEVALSNGAISIPDPNDEIVRVTITMNDHKPQLGDVTLKRQMISLVAGAPDTERDIKAINIRGVPVVPSEDTSMRIYIEWIDADGAAHSTDKAPSERPNVSWSIIAPNGAGWDASVEPLADPFGAMLTIGPKKDGTTMKCQELAVRASLSYDGAEELVCTRKFFAGRFPTQVLIGPEQQEMIDSANAILAQTQVSILPGNFQDPIPAHILEMIAQRIEDGLVEYAAADEASDRSAAAEKVELKPLYDLETIKSMTVEEPEIDTIPVCFKTTGKNSANITLDLARGGLGGEIVLLPMTYSVTFDSEKLDEFFGDAAESILDDPTSDENIARIFDVLVLHKRIKEGAMKGWYTRLVDGVASPAAARDLGMLDVSATDDDGARELTVRLAYNVINCSGESFYVNDPDVGYLILPDGAMNDTLIDPLWSNAWDRPANNGVVGGSGGGCAAGASVIAIAAFAISRRRR